MASDSKSQTPMAKSEINRRAAAWWAQWLPEDKREAFIAELIKRLPEDDYSLHSDHDPEPPLLDALHAAGIRCRGCLFSSKDIGFPCKTGLRREDGVLYLKWGYGANYEPLRKEHFRND